MADEKSKKKALVIKKKKAEEPAKKQIAEEYTSSQKSLLKPSDSENIRRLRDFKRDITDEEAYDGGVIMPESRVQLPKGMSSGYTPLDLQAAANEEINKIPPRRITVKYTESPRSTNSAYNGFFRANPKFSLVDEVFGDDGKLLGSKEYNDLSFSSPEFYNLVKQYAPILRSSGVEFNPEVTTSLDERLKHKHKKDISTGVQKDWVDDWLDAKRPEDETLWDNYYDRVARARSKKEAEALERKIAAENWTKEQIPTNMHRDARGGKMSLPTVKEGKIRMSDSPTKMAKELEARSNAKYGITQDIQDDVSAAVESGEPIMSGLVYAKQKFDEMAETDPAKYASLKNNPVALARYFKQTQKAWDMEVASYNQPNKPLDKDYLAGVPEADREAEENLAKFKAGLQSEVDKYTEKLSQEGLSDEVRQGLEEKLADAKQRLSVYSDVDSKSGNTNPDKLLDTTVRKGYTGDYYSSLSNPVDKVNKVNILDPQERRQNSLKAGINTSTEGYKDRDDKRKRDISKLLELGFRTGDFNPLIGPTMPYADKEASNFIGPVKKFPKRDPITRQPLYDKNGNMLMHHIPESRADLLDIYNLNTTNSPEEFTQQWQNMSDYLGGPANSDESGDYFTDKYTNYANRRKNQMYAMPDVLHPGQYSMQEVSPVVYLENNMLEDPGFLADVDVPEEDIQLFNNTLVPNTARVLKQDVQEPSEEEQAKIARMNRLSGLNPAIYKAYMTPVDDRYHGDAMQALVDAVAQRKQEAKAATREAGNLREGARQAARMFSTPDNPMSEEEAQQILNMYSKNNVNNQREGTPGNDVRSNFSNPTFDSAKNAVYTSINPKGNNSNNANLHRMLFPIFADSLRADGPGYKTVNKIYTDRYGTDSQFERLLADYADKQVSPNQLAKYMKGQMLNNRKYPYFVGDKLQNINWQEAAPYIAEVLHDYLQDNNVKPSDSIISALTDRRY